MSREHVDMSRLNLKYSIEGGIWRSRFPKQSSWTGNLIQLLLSLDAELATFQNWDP
jgi:hypothetical protein